MGSPYCFPFTIPRTRKSKMGGRKLNFFPSNVVSKENNNFPISHEFFFHRPEKLQPPKYTQKNNAESEKTNPAFNFCFRSSPLPHLP